jgi:hypothetical protein
LGFGFFNRRLTQIFWLGIIGGWRPWVSQLGLYKSVGAVGGQECPHYDGVVSWPSMPNEKC